MLREIWERLASPQKGGRGFFNIMGRKKKQAAEPKEGHTKSKVKFTIRNTRYA